MSHIDVVDPSDWPELQPVFAGAAAAMGFVPNSMLTMAHIPQLPAAFSLLATVAFGGDIQPMLQRLADRFPAPLETSERLPASLVQLIAFATSLSAGCRYCQAHTAHNAARSGADAAQIDAILNYARSPEFSAAETAALDLAFAAGRVPNEASADHFRALREHFSERQIVQIVAVIALFGFLNRWNDTVATPLEAAPDAFAKTTLTHLGWGAGKHL
jgi:uncharacterized peroxidase-related enzyme